MVEITGTYQNEYCDHCGLDGTADRENCIIEFVVTSHDDAPMISVHRYCLASILKNYGTGIDINKCNRIDDLLNKRHAARWTLLLIGAGAAATTGFVCDVIYKLPINVCQCFATVIGIGVLFVSTWLYLKVWR